MNVETLLKEDRTHELVADGNWKHTDYYEIDSGSYYFGCANLISLSKQITTNATAALIYLFQRLYKGSEAFKNDEVALSANELLKWLIGAGYIGSPEGVSAGSRGSSQGVKLLPQLAASKVQEILQALLQSKEARVLKNGQEITPSTLFNAQEVKTVIAFKDKEDDYLYFIETNTAWMYFSWGTSA